LAWLNSDDTYQIGVVEQVAQLFSQWPNVDVISGRCRLFYKDGSEDMLEPSSLRTLEDFLKINFNWVNRRQLIQPEVFFRRGAFEKAGGLRDELHFCMDSCLWIDMAKSGSAFESVDRHWANWRMHEGKKSRGQTEGFSSHARVAWDRLRENWGRLDNPIAVADASRYRARSRISDTTLAAVEGCNRQLGQTAARSAFPVGSYSPPDRDWFWS
jgi:hypothetical protein